jgi:hypothetical protein
MNTLLGQVEPLGSTIGKISIPKIDTSKQVDKGKHNRRIVLWAAPRGAFLGLIRLNVWGLATLLSKQAFEVDEATTKKQSAPNYWWDVQARWRNAWWNLGGTWQKFIDAVNKGKGRKPLGFKLAPKKIKDKLKAAGIGNVYFNQGIGVDPGTGTVIASSAVLITAISPIVLALINKKSVDESFPEIVYEDELDGGEGEKSGFSLTDESGKLTTAGLGLIGAGVMALLIFGTKPIKAKRKK